MESFVHLFKGGRNFTFEKQVFNTVLFFTRPEILRILGIPLAAVRQSLCAADEWINKCGQGQALSLRLAKNRQRAKKERAGTEARPYNANIQASAKPIPTRKGRRISHFLREADTGLTQKRQSRTTYAKSPRVGTRPVSAN